MRVVIKGKKREVKGRGNHRQKLNRRKHQPEEGAGTKITKLRQFI